MNQDSLNNNVDQQLSEALSFFRIKEVLFNPSLVPGCFNDQHLKDLHSYIFQDSPEHKPGITRSNTKDIWFKDRQLEVVPDLEGNLVKQPIHPVAYVNQHVGKELNQVLKNNKVEKLAQLSLEEFSVKISDLYSKLDYIHAFYEGNSRTLRTFTYLIAKDSGYILDWNTSNVTAETRNQLYNARDLAVYEHFYDGQLNSEYTKKHAFKNNIEYYIAMKSNAFKTSQEQLNTPTLKNIISQSLTNIPENKEHSILNTTLSFTKLNPLKL